MMRVPDTPLVKEVVLIGGGHAHALMLRKWAMAPVEGARLTVINPKATAPYTGMLPGFVAGHYTRDELEIDLVRLARTAGARLIFGLATGIDRDAKRIQVSGRPDVAYDIASIDIGITSEMPDIPGFTDYAVAAKPLGPFAVEWQAYVDNAQKGPVAIIGGGIAGVELALAMHHRLASRGTTQSITLIEAKTLLGDTDPAPARKLRSVLDASNITVLENSQPKRITEDGVELISGAQIASSFVVGAAGARPFPWLETTGLTLENGFIAVDKYLRSVNDPSVYAVGDCAHIVHAPRPKAGVFAVRSAPVLTTNIRADLTGTQRQPFNPQKHYLKLVSLGQKSAMVDKYGLALSGPWAWTWKDRIDQAFMTRLNSRPKMAAPKQSKNTVTGAWSELGDKALCGGCGSKVGAQVLDDALSKAKAETSPDILTSVGDDAAVLAFGGEKQVITTDHLRAFWDDPYVMTRIAALHALGDVWAMGAQPQALLAQITLPRMSERLQEAWLEEILSATSQVCQETGAALVGGHTTQGAELTVGFTATGTLSVEAMTLDRARQGDALILTRPIGSGTLMAGEMSGDARGDDIQSLLSVLTKAQRSVADALVSAANALTDVTGFGLAGHAKRMADASGLTASINLHDIPTFSGAADLAEMGVASTIAPANEAYLEAPLPNTPKARLLIDPQTAGGFLAAVPSEKVASVLEALASVGETAAVIGDFQKHDGGSLKVA